MSELHSLISQDISEDIPSLIQKLMSEYTLTEEESFSFILQYLNSLNSKTLV